MKKVFTLLLLAATLTLQAQLPDGSIAPDWTATDIDGNEWNLYELLAEGKSVVIEVTATWSDQSWQYHETGALTEFYNQYGPGGTDEAMVFFFEADDETDAADLDGTGDNTAGNWLENTPYPIIDGAEWIADLYEAFGYPNNLHICPNRLLQEMGQATTFALYQQSQSCLVPGGQNNAGIYLYVGFEGDFCEEKTFAPSLIWQNLGSENITSAEFELYLDGALQQSLPWTGDMPPFTITPQAFAPVTVTESSAVSMVIAAVNGAADDDDSNNTWQIESTVAPSTGQNALYLELLTDDYPTETFWEILDANGTVFHRGGNPGIFDNVQLSGTYFEANTTYLHAVPLPADGCYEFVIYDEFGDGICCGYGLGSYRLRDQNNAVVLQGGLFTDTERRPFSLAGAATITDDAAIFNYQGAEGEFCGVLELTPTVTLQNLGSNDLTSVEIEVADGASVLQNFTHSTLLAPGETEALQLDAFSIDASTELTISVLSTNGQPDMVPSGNTIEVELLRRLTTTPALTLEIQTDEWGYEIYWEMRTLSGKTIASGGNQTVGPNGGGLRVATEDDPGAYPQFELITEQILLPDGVDDCYEFLFVDDWGDGLSGDGFLKLTDEMGNILFHIFPTGTYDAHLIDTQLAPSNVQEIGALAGLAIFPNPAGEQLQVSFSLSQNAALEVEVVDLLGRPVAEVANGRFAAGQHSLPVDLVGLPAGVYFLKIMDEEGFVVRRFVRG